MRKTCSNWGWDFRCVEAQSLKNKSMCACLCSVDHCPYRHCLLIWNFFFCIVAYCCMYCMCNYHRDHNNTLHVAIYMWYKENTSVEPSNLNDCVSFVKWVNKPKKSFLLLHCHCSLSHFMSCNPINPSVSMMPHCKYCPWHSGDLCCVLFAYDSLRAY